jgi:hypothetical protein
MLSQVVGDGIDHQLRRRIRRRMIDCQQEAEYLLSTAPFQMLDTFYCNPNLGSGI